MNSSTSGWLVLTRNFVAGSHPQNDNVATDSNGKPLDADGDGLPDYLEDTNGDGTYNAGDLSNWNSSDTDSDGVSDYIEVVQGRNPRVSGTTNDVSGLINLRLYTPLK